MRADREYRLAIHGIEVAVMEWGERTLPPLLMLHGWLDNAASFCSIAEYLKCDFRCIAVDLPGHGEAEHLPGTVNYHFLDGVQNIYEVCEALALAPVTLIGHSMGGALGMLYSGAFPERVTKFVSIEAFGPIIRPAAEAATQFAHAVREHIQRRVNRKTVFSTVDAAVSVRGSVADCDAQLLRPIVERSLVACDGGFQWSSDARLRLPGLLRLSEDQVASFIRSVSAPVMTIKADKGLAFVSDAIARFGGLLKHHELVQLKGGHHIHLEQPEAVVDLIKRFLRC